MDAYEAANFEHLRPISFCLYFADSNVQIMYFSDFLVYMTVAVDFVVSGISEPVRFIKELGIKVYPSSERFWNPSRPKIKEQYILELKLVHILCI